MKLNSKYKDIIVVINHMFTQVHHFDVVQHLDHVLYHLTLPIKEHVLQTAHSVANQKQRGMMGSHNYIDLSWSQNCLSAFSFSNTPSHKRDQSLKIWDFTDCNLQTMAGGKYDPKFFHKWFLWQKLHMLWSNILHVNSFIWYESDLNLASALEMFCTRFA